MEGQKLVESFDDIGFQHQSRSLHSDNRTALLISAFLCFFGILSLMLNIARLVRRRDEPTEDGNAHVHGLGGVHMGTNPAAISIREAIANNLSRLQRRALLENFFSNDINVSEENENENESENDIENKTETNDHNAKNDTTSKNTIELVEEGRDCDSGTCNSNSRDMDLEAFESLPVYCGTPTRQRLHKMKISDEECQSTPQTCITEESPCSLNSRPAIETDKDTDADADADADASADADADVDADTPGFKLSTPEPLIPEYQIMGPIISFPIALDDVSVSTNHPHPRARSDSESNIDNADIEHRGTVNIHANNDQREDLNCEDSISELDVCSICLDTYGKKETAINILHLYCYLYSYACRIVA